MNSRNTVLNLFCILALAIVSPSMSPGQNAEPSFEPPTGVFPAELEQYLSQETLAIGVIDLVSCDLEQFTKMQTSLSGMGEQTADQKIKEAKQLQKLVDKLSAAGVDQLFVMLSPQDLSLQRTTWAGKVKTHGDIAAALSALSAIHKMLGITGKPIVRERVLIGGLRDRHVEALTNCDTQPADTAREALTSLSGYEFGVVLIGSDDSRKILGELSPKFPPPFHKLSGEALVKGIQWGSIGFSLKTERGNCLIQCNNEQLPQQLEQTLPSVGQFLHERNWVAPQIADLLPGSLKTKVKGNQFLVDFASLLKSEGGLIEVMGAITAVQNGQEHLAQLGAIVRGCHAYEEAHKSLPTTANYDDDGKPLLSWRVHILPYMNQNNFYRLFRLDEPWDSEHNLKLANIIPVCYFAADATDVERRSGKTVYVRPTGKGTLFDGANALNYGEIHDGTVNTVMVLRTSPDNAVVWTKPTDWEFDPENPRRGLGLQPNEKLKVATVDSGAHVLRADISDDQLRNLIDPQDGNLLSMEEVTK